MSRQLLARDCTVVGFDLSEVAREHLVEAGGQVAATAAEAVRGADVVIFMLPNSDIVESVLAEISDAITPETLLIDMSSSEPMRTRALAASRV